MARSVIVGGSSGLGLVIAKRLVARGEEVVVTTRDATRAATGVVGDSPKWRDVPAHPHIARTPIGRLVTMAEVADATEFLLRNTGVNAQDLVIDGGVLVT